MRRRAIALAAGVLLAMVTACAPAPEAAPATSTPRPVTCELGRVGADVMSSPSLDVQCDTRVCRVSTRAGTDLKPANARITGWQLRQVRVWPLNDRSGATVTWWVQTPDGTRQVGSALVCADRGSLPVDGLCVGRHA